MGGTESYKTVAVLGKGRSGVVKKVERLFDQKLFACKVIHFREGEVSSKDAEREYATLSRLHHPHIVEYVDYHWQPEKAKLYMGYCSGGDLQQFIKQRERLRSAVPETQVWCVLSQLASALRYCHYGISTTEEGRLQATEWDPIIHRDIKPANVMICSINHDKIFVKLGDYGLSRIIDGETMPASYAGTHQYLPPEIARSNPSGIVWTKKCDIFSLGCTLYAMCTWKAPFSWRMEESDVFDDIPVTFSEKLRRCIASCLAFNSEERPDAFDLLRLVQRMGSDTKTRHLVPLLNQSQETSHHGADSQYHRQTAVERYEHTDILRLSLPGSADNSGNLKKDHSHDIEPTSPHFAATTLHPRPPTPPWSRSPRSNERAMPALNNTKVLPTSQPIPRFPYIEKVLIGHLGWVVAVAFSPDGKQIVSASKDKTVRLWDSTTGACRTLNGHSHRVIAVAFSPNGKQIVSASADKTVRLWDSATGRQHRILLCHSGVVLDAAFSFHEKQIVSISSDISIRLWNLNRKKRRRIN